MARPSNTLQRRREIVLGLRQAMAELGYERATVADIAAAAGLTTGLVHYHFANKLEILLALIDNLAEELQQRLDQKLATAGPVARTRLHAFIDVHLALGAAADPQMLACWVVIGSEAVRQPLVQEAFQRVIAREMGVLEELVAAALTEGSKKNRDARSIAAAIYASIEGYYVLAATAPHLIPAGSAAPTMHLLVDGLL